MKYAAIVVAVIGIELGLMGCSADDPSARSSGAGSAANSTAQAISTGAGLSTTGPGSGNTTSGAVNTESDGDGPRFDVGQDQPLPDVPGKDCPDVQVVVTPTVPTVLLVVDQSSSMNDFFSGTSRWNAVYQTLMDPAAGVVSQLETAVRFGLTLYSSQGGAAGGQCPLLTQVPTALDNRNAINAVYAGSFPIDDTPTGDTIAIVSPALAAFPEPGPKIIILATDGDPDTCVQPDPNQGHTQAILSVQGAFASGIETFIISVGNQLSEAHLQQMANAGVGLPLNAAVPAPYYQALGAGELVVAFQQIIGQVVDCSLTLDTEVQVALACEGTVLLDGVPLECNTEWTVPNPTTLELIGAACDLLRNGQPHTVTATFPCDVVGVRG